MRRKTEKDNHRVLGSAGFDLALVRRREREEEEEEEEE